MAFRVVSASSAILRIFIDNVFLLAIVLAHPSEQNMSPSALPWVEKSRTSMASSIMTHEASTGLDSFLRTSPIVRLIRRLVSSNEVTCWLSIVWRNLSHIVHGKKKR